MPVTIRISIFLFLKGWPCVCPPFQVGCMGQWGRGPPALQSLTVLERDGPPSYLISLKAAKITVESE